MIKPDPFDEEVNGIIIGGDAPLVRGRLYYDGRMQSDWLRADSEAELRELAIVHKRKLIDECGQVAYQIYPLDAWELRIYGGAAS